MISKLFKKTIAILMTFFFCFFFSQSKYKNILKSSSIDEIEDFLKEAHPDDPRRTILKKKLIQLKNDSWVKGAKNHKPMAPRSQTYIPIAEADTMEVQEFKKLVSYEMMKNKEKTVKFLDTMFNENVDSKEIILLIKNESDCNIILRIHGQDERNVPVYAHRENTVILNKGEYLLKSNVCGTSYVSQKKIIKNLEISLKKVSQRIIASVNLYK